MLGRAALVACLFFGASLASAAAPVEQRIQRIEQNLVPPVIVKGAPFIPTTLSQRMAALQVPGVSIAVIHNGQIEWARGFGVARIGGPPVTTDTLFQAASISKPITALGVLRLVEQGTLNLDADVDTYLKSWKIPPTDLTARNKVTLRRLLTHTGGMTAHGFEGYDGALVDHIIRTVAREYGWPDLQPPERAVAKVDPKAFAGYVGTYKLNAEQTLTVTLEGHQLFSQISGQPRRALLPMAEREFFMKEMDERIVFTTDAQGRATRITQLHFGVEDVSPRVTD